MIASLLLAAALIAQSDIVGSEPGCRAIDDYHVAGEHYRVKLNDKWADVLPAAVWHFENLSERGVICFDDDANVYLLIPKPER